MTTRGSSSPGAKPVIGLAAATLLSLTSFVAYHEGYVPHTYADPVGIPTICFGHTGPDVTPGRVATRAECEALLSADLARAYEGVRRCITTPMRDHQAAALTSFTYNVGAAALCRSTLAQYANAGDWARACAELDKWVFAKKRRLPGLVKRRAEERALCEGRQPQ